MIRIDRAYFPFSIHWNTNTRKKKKRNYNEFSWILLLLTHNDEIFIRVYVLERHFLMRNNRLRVSWQFRQLPAVKIVSLFVFFLHGQFDGYYSLPGYSRSPHRKGSLYAQMVASLYTASISLITRLYWKKEKKEEK